MRTEYRVFICVYSTNLCNYNEYLKVLQNIKVFQARYYLREYMRYNIWNRSTQENVWI
jgi:hypothetical protein